MAFKDKLAHLLDERRIATLTTYGADDMPHVTAVWYLWEDGALYIATSLKTGKGRNLQRDPRMALCIESREPGKESGMTAVGRAELITGEAAMPLSERINGKYLTPAALAHPVIGPAFVDMSDLVVRLVPERWISWDMEEMGEMFGEAIDEAEFFYPTLP